MTTNSIAPDAKDSTWLTLKILAEARGVSVDQLVASILDKLADGVLSPGWESDVLHRWYGDDVEKVAGLAWEAMRGRPR